MPPQKDKLEIFLLISVIVAILLTITIVSLWPTTCKVKEGFTTSDSALTTCPFGTKTMYTKKGELVCCKGTVNGTQCEGKVLCTFSSPSGNLKTCKTVVDDYMNEKQAKFCPSELPRYFEGAGGYPAGCTSARLLPDRTAPADSLSEKCDVFNSDLDNLVPTSCKNTLPSNFTPEENSKPKKVNIRQNYVLSFKIRPTSTQNSWSNIFHYTVTNTDGGAFGSRSPAVWFWPNSTKLHIILGDASDWNWGLHMTDELPRNEESTVIITCKDKAINIVVNGKQYSLTQPTRRPEGDALLYRSDPWWPSAKAYVSGFSYRPL